MKIESSKQILIDLKKCALKANVHQKMFICFGTLLGAVRERSIIEHDTDMDIGFLPLTAEEKEKYFKCCSDAGLMDGWPVPSDRVTSKPTGEILWFSAKSGKKETKCCNWFFEEWSGMMWHTKGKTWVNKDLFDPHKNPYDLNDEAIMKGAPGYCFNSLSQISLFGELFLAPEKTGTILDFWYPNWFYPTYGGESSFETIAKVGKWHNKETWSII